MSTTKTPTLADKQCIYWLDQNTHSLSLRMALKILPVNELFQHLTFKIHIIASLNIKHIISNRRSRKVNTFLVV